MTVGDQIGRIVGAPPGSTVMHQNVAVRRGDRAVVLPPVDAHRNRDRLRGRQLPVGALPLPGAAGARRRRRRGRRGDRRRDRRAHAARPDHPRPLQDRRDPGRRARSSRRAHEVGAHVVLDAYQSAGIVPLDVTALDVDFAVGGSVKWLCGGPGTAGSTSGPISRSALEPTFTGWQAHARPFALRGGAAIRRRRGALPHRHAERARALRRDRRATT